MEPDLSPAFGRKLPSDRPNYRGGPPHSDLPRMQPEPSILLPVGAVSPLKLNGKSPFRHLNVVLELPPVCHFLAPMPTPGAVPDRLA
jgi:hypothetical protein